MISFSGRHYPPFIILQCVRWYVSYALSYRNIEEMMGERGFKIDHAALNRWVLHFSTSRNTSIKTSHPHSNFIASRPSEFRPVAGLLNLG